jgi:thiol-disulfide isomerase/thioredoxin
MTKYLIVYLLLFTIAANSYGQPKKAILIGNLDFLTNKDSVKLDVAKLKSFFHDADFITSYRTSVNSHVFKFEIPVNNYPQYADLIFSKAKTDKSIPNLIVEEGDSVSILQTKRGYLFEGQGSFKYNVILHLKNIFIQKFRYYNSDDPAIVLQNYENHDSIAIAELLYLDTCKSQLSEKVYLLLKADIIGMDLSKGFTIFPFYPQLTTPFIYALKNFKQEGYLTAKIASLERDTNNLINSLGYCQSIIFRYKIDSCYLKGKDFNIKGCYTYLKNNYRGNFRDGLVTYFLFDRRRGTQDISDCINDALGFMVDTDFRNVLLKVRSSNLKGSTAADFSLVDANNHTRSFSDFKGKVILIDFWFTGCGACRATAPILSKIEHLFANKPVVFISISIDGNKNIWLKSLANGKYTSKTSINLFTGGKRDTDPIIRHYSIAAFPTLILIDKNGKLTDGVGDIRYDNGKRLEAMINSVL